MSVENRQQHRLAVALEVFVRGTDRYGLPFEEKVVSDDISRGGCALDLSQELEIGAELAIEILRRVPGRGGLVPFLTQGVVLRTVKLEMEKHHVGIRFTGPQFPTYSSENS